MSERIDTNETTTDSSAEYTDGCQAAPGKRVRERSREGQIHVRRQDRADGPAHPSNRLLAQLNTNWRAVDDPLQWILQRRKGNPRKKNSGWRNRSFCRTRDALLRCVREHCGEIDPEALATLKELPD